MICPTCPAKPLALYQCDDNVHRCYACKRSRRTVPSPAPVAEPAPQLITEHTRIIQARVHLRNRIFRMESLTDWDKSPWNCGKHEGLSEALEILNKVSE